MSWTLSDAWTVQWKQGMSKLKPICIKNIKIDISLNAVIFAIFLGSF